MDQAKDTDADRYSPSPCGRGLGGGGSATADAPSPQPPPARGGGVLWFFGSSRSFRASLVSQPPAIPPLSARRPRRGAGLRLPARPLPPPCGGHRGPRPPGPAARAASRARRRLALPRRRRTDAAHQSADRGRGPPLLVPPRRRSRSPWSAPPRSCARPATSSPAARRWPCRPPACSSRDRAPCAPS